MSEQAVATVVAAALGEDVGAGDRTTETLVPNGIRCRARLLLEEPGVVCGLPLAAAVFATLDEHVSLKALVPEGTIAGTAPVMIAEVSGPARPVLTGERTALNLVARLSGIATLTRRYVDAVAGTGVTILDTRKTTPGLRALEKYAVRCGGATNHRLGLHDAILVKENHLRLTGGISAAVATLSAHAPGVPVEIEAESLEQVEEALVAGVTRILLDNMTPSQVAEAVAVVDGRAKLEASGGISLDNVRAYAETGVDFISIGALTHSARSLHVSLEVQ